MHESPVLKLAVSIIVLLMGLGCGWYYLRGAQTRDALLGPFAGQRPWRELGAAICVVVAVMFVLGVYLVDIPDHPRAYALYWTIILGLLLWLCALAVKDVKYTLHLIRMRRQQRGADEQAEQAIWEARRGDRS